jgi:hypothetical protein
MSRLLHAAARGARIEPPNAYEYASVKTINGKVQSSKFWIARDTENGYIHPNDEHLAYGPISTALREISQQDIHYLQDATGVYEQAAIEDYATHGELGYCWDNAANATAMHKSLFLLILAEALADSGL